jgi:hypothetical protein
MKQTIKHVIQPTSFITKFNSFLFTYGKATVKQSLFGILFLLTIGYNTKTMGQQPLAGSDELGRVLPNNPEVGDPKENKHVGMFYFLWMGHSASLTSQTHYDLDEIIPANNAVLYDFDHADWGSTHSAYYFWDKPLYDYYKGTDYWVHLKNMQLLADAGVDFLFIDATNAIHYPAENDALMQAIVALQNQGRDAPKIVQYTNSNSVGTMQAIYNDFYKSGAAYRYPTTWYYLDGKPLIIGDQAAASDTDYATFFTFRANQWPTEPKKTNGWPWIDFNRPQQVHQNANGQNEVINVSVAQHPNLDMAMGGTAFYGGTGNWGRSYRNGSPGNPATDLAYGYNVQEQWDYAISQDVPYVLVTGWNEWIVGRWHYSRNGRGEWSQFVDQASPEYSRDIEPSATNSVIRDNYYMQLIANIRKYKGLDSLTTNIDEVSITSMSDWATASNSYWDYTGDVLDRNHASAIVVPLITLTNTTGRNDFETLKFSKDATNLYFYAKTVDNITANSGTNWMTLLINQDRAITGWEGFDYRVVSGNQLQSYSGSAWTNLATVTYTVLDNEMYITIPRSQITNGSEAVDLEFKWSDNMQDDTEPLDWYINGDAAPGSRLCYVASEVTPAVIPADAVNGFLSAGFESPVITGFAQAPSNSDWTFSGTSGFVANGSAYGNVNAPEGTQAAYIQENGEISQQLYVSKTQNYAIKFQTAQRPSQNQTLEILVDGINVGSVTAASTGYEAYTSAAVSLQGGQNHTITVKGTNPLGGDHTAFVDGMELYTVPADAVDAFLNEGFENPSVVGFQQSPSNADWSFTGTSGILDNGSVYGNTNAPEGTQAAYIQENGEITQEIHSSVTKDYVIKFQTAQRPSQNQTLAVYVNGDSIGTVTPDSSSYEPYTSETISLTGGLNHTITIKGTNPMGGDNTAFVDALTLDEAIPVPAVNPNLGFEMPVIATSPGYVYNPTGGSWTFSGSAGLLANGGGFGNPNAPEGIQSCFLQGFGHIEQTINIATAGTYELKLKAAQRTGNTQTFKVYCDANLIATITPSPTSFLNYSTAGFTVATGNHTFKLEGTNPLGGDNTVFLDALEIAVAIPTFNTSFETPSIAASPGYAYTPTGGNWIFDSQSGIVKDSGGFGNPNAPDGTQACFLQQSGTVEQIVSFPVTGSYSISIKAAQRAGNTQTFKVYINGNSIGTITPSSTSYLSYTINNFSVNSGNNTIKLEGTNPLSGDNTAFIDAIDLQFVSTAQSKSIAKDVEVIEKVNGLQLTTYPNPFSEYTNVSFSLENASVVRFEVYSFSGQKVISKAKEYPSGQHEMKISADHLKAGIYLLRVRSDDQVEMMKVILQ